MDRYDPELCTYDETGSCSCFMEMDECDDGDYIRHDDYAKERDLLLAIRGAARGFIDAMAEWEYDEAQGKMIAALDAYDEAMK